MGGNRPVWSAFDVLGSIGRGVYPPVAPADDSLFGAVAGTYVGRPGAGQPVEMVIVRDRRGLVCQTSDQELNGRIAHLADDRFFYRVNPNQRLVFLRDAFGEITALEITNLAYEGFHLRLRRVR